jgi:hypothetical protein
MVACRINTRWVCEDSIAIEFYGTHEPSDGKLNTIYWLVAIWELTL